MRSTSGSATNLNAFAYGIPLGTNLTLIASAGGTYRAVACNDQYLFVGQGTTFQVYNIAVPASPVFVSSVTVPGLIQAIALNGNYAVVAAKDAGIHIVDISNANVPRLRGFYDTPGIAYGVAVLSNRAYVADGNSGLLILDIANPDAPLALSSLNLGSSSYDVALKADGNGFHAFLPANGTMFVVDVADPQLPVKIAESPVEGSNYSIALAGNLAFIGSFLMDGVGVIDISTPNTPVSGGRILAGGNYYQTVASYGNSVVLVGMGGDKAFQLVDASGVSTIARGYLPESAILHDLGRNRAVVRNNMAWLACGGAVYGVNVSNPDSPQRTWNMDNLGGRFEKNATLGSTVAATTQDKVFGFNYTNNSLTLTANQAVRGQSCALFFYGATLFSFDGSGDSLAYRFQHQSGGLLTPLASCSIPDFWTAAACPAGNTLLSLSESTTDNHGVITEHDPAGVNWSIRQKGLTSKVALNGTQIVGTSEFFVVSSLDVVNGGFILEYWDWSASTPRWRVSGYAFIQALKLSHNNRFLHVGDERKYLIFDLAETSTPHCISTNTTTDYVRDIHIEDESAYLACSGQGVVVYDITDKLHPSVQRAYNTPGSAYSISKTGDRLFVSDYDGGVQVLGLPDIVKPEVFITAPVAASVFQTTNSTCIIGGVASDSSGQIERIVWSNDRGGGGTASGTVDWSTPAISLQPGTNVIGITVFDSGGNEGYDAITVVYSPADNGEPVVVITSPKPDAEFTISTAIITLSGTAVDNQSVSSVTWINARTGSSGTASLTSQLWSVTNLTLALGPNPIHVTATDAVGNSATDDVLIFYAPPDINAPAITVDFPTVDAIYETSYGSVNISGSASDDMGVTRVEWSCNYGERHSAAGTAPWGVNGITLTPGLNVIEVTAYDEAGNFSIDVLSVIYTPLVRLVTFNAQGGAATPASVTVTNGSYYGFLPMPTRTGYTFDGWWTGENGTGNLVTTNSLIEAVTDYTLYARWSFGDVYVVIDLTGGTNAASYPVSFLDSVPAGGWTDEYKTSKLVMRKIPAGTFTMGSPTNELGRWVGETQHTVTLTKGFYIGVFEVTQRQWELVMGNNPSYFTNATCYATRPVETVSYNNIRGASLGAGWPTNGAVDAVSFMGKLRNKTGMSDFDLPTESQWEYACRAGTTTALNTGYNLTNTVSDARMSEAGRYPYNGGLINGITSPSRDCTTDNATAKAGSYLPNAWGLYDMHGNVMELCLDWWYLVYTSTVSDPVGAVSGSNRILRGGRWDVNGMWCRSAVRGGATGPSSMNSLYGLRVAWTLATNSASYTVSFDARGGVVNPQSMTVFYGATYGTLPVPVRQGYTFIGWRIGEGITSEEVTSETQVSTFGDQVLYAEWVANAYRVLFDAQGGSVDMAEKDVTFGQVYGYLPTPSRPYYTFTGWKNYVNGTNFLVTAETIVSTASLHTLYAHWDVVATSWAPVPVPFEWLDQYPIILLVAGGNHNVAALIDLDMDGLLSWQEYVAGTDPTNKTSVFMAQISVSNGLPWVTWAPDLGVARVYTVVGKTNLADTAWGPTNAASRFFRVKVDMP